jgi:hypothetical protein
MKLPGLDRYRYLFPFPEDYSVDGKPRIFSDGTDLIGYVILMDRDGYLSEVLFVTC